MADISFDNTANDIIIQGGDLVFTSDTDFTETMKQRIRAVMLTFLGEWFLDDKNDPQVGIPYFQSLFEKKLPTLDLADTIFRTALLDIEGVVAVDSLAFDYDGVTRVLEVTFRVNITGDGAFVEDIISFNPLG